MFMDKLCGLFELYDTGILRELWNYDWAYNLARSVYGKGEGVEPQYLIIDLLDWGRVRVQVEKQVRIQDLVKGGPQLLRPKVADIAKQSRASEVSNLQPGSMARLRALEAFGFLMLKYAFSHILETLFLSFLTSILTPKVDKNRILEFTSINLRHSCILHLFFNLHEKVML